MSKKALLIGINYRGTSQQLQGCINDMIQWYGLLQDAYGFEAKDIVFLRDDKSDFRPTKQRILSEFRNIIASKAETIFIGYSGHGTQIQDRNGDEIDGMDECLVPSDVQSSGVIIDDEINAIVKNSESNIFAVFDCCRSGTVLDLSYNGISKNLIEPPSSKKIICFSGCKDSEDALEVYNTTNMLPQGLLTIVLIEALRRFKYTPTIATLYNEVNSIISSGGISQTPQISSTYEVSSLVPFPFSKDGQQTVLLQQQNTRLQQQNIQIEQQVISLQRQNTELLQKNAQIMAEIEKQKNTPITLTKEVEALQNAVKKSQQQTVQLQQQNTQLQQRINTVINVNNNTQASMRALQARVNTLIQENTSLKTRK